MVGLWRGERAKVLGRLGCHPLAPTKSVCSILPVARRLSGRGVGSSFGPSFCPEHRGFAAVRPFALPQSYDAGVFYVEVSKPVVLMYIRNLATYRAMTTPPAVLVLLDWGYASPGCGAPGQ
jgi:hypothetical protein